MLLEIYLQFFIVVELTVELFTKSLWKLLELGKSHMSGCFVKDKWVIVLSGTVTRQNTNAIEENK